MMIVCFFNFQSMLRTQQYWRYILLYYVNILDQLCFIILITQNVICLHNSQLVADVGTLKRTEKSCGQNKISIKLVVHKNAFKNKTFFLQPSSKSIKATSHFNFRLQLKFLIGTLKLFYFFQLASKLFLSLFQSNIGYFSFKTFNFNYVFVAARTKILKYPFPI